MTSAKASGLHRSEDLIGRGGKRATSPLPGFAVGTDQAKFRAKGAGVLRRTSTTSQVRQASIEQAAPRERRDRAGAHAGRKAESAGPDEIERQVADSRDRVLFVRSLAAWIAKPPRDAMAPSHRGKPFGEPARVHQTRRIIDREWSVNGTGAALRVAVIDITRMGPTAVQSPRK